MKFAAHTHPNADWRSDAARLRSRGNSCSNLIGNAYGMKPATATVIAFPTIRPARRGAPPQ